MKERCPVVAEWGTAPTLGGRGPGDWESGGGGCSNARVGKSGTLCPPGLCHIRGPENQCSQGTSLLARDDSL